MTKQNGLIKFIVQKKWMLLIIFVSIFVFTSLFLRGVFTNYIYSSGDEPHYLMMADSLLRDGDFNLKNQYQDSAAATRYSQEIVFPHLSPGLDFQNSNNWYSIHTIGLPIIIALPFKLFGLNGTRLFILVLQIAALPLFYMVLRKYLKKDERVLVGMLMVLCCTFFWQNLAVTMPDLVLVSMALGSILLFGKKDIWNNLLFSILIGAGVLIHTKFALAALPIYIAHNYVLLRQLGYKKLFKDMWASYLVLFIFMLGYALFLKNTYGFYSPSGLYGSNGQLFGANLATNLIAILFDRVKGLVIYYPVLLIAGPYIYFAIRDLIISSKKILKSRTVDDSLVFAWAIAIALLLFLVTQVGFTDWSGSFAPSGRYMLLPIFLIAFLVAKYFNHQNKYETIPLALLMGLSLLIAAGLIYRINIFREMGFVYLGPAEDSIITQRIGLLQKMPLFAQTSSQSSAATIKIGSLLLLTYTILSTVLVRLFGKREKE